jgi:opacity protein-like surface antigen
MKKFLGAATLLMLAVGASPTMAQVGSGIYLRADAGAGLATDMMLKDTDGSNPSSTLGGVTYTGDTVKSVLASVGIGYRLSPVFRIDLTASYLPGLRFSGGDNAGLGTVANAKIKPRFALVNGYVDFGTLAGMPATSVQPYVVASLGASRNQIGDVSLIAASGTFLTVSGRTKTDMAWGLGAGIGFPLGRLVTFDLMYKYLDLGAADTSSLLSVGGVAAQGTAVTAQLHVHTVTAGLRVGF